AQNDHGRLGELRVLDRGEGVGDPRPGGDRGHTGDAGQPEDGVGGEHGVHLVPGVDDPDSALLGADEDGRDVAAAQGEEEAHALADQDLSDQISSVHAGGSFGLGGSSTCRSGTTARNSPAATVSSPRRTSTCTRRFLPVSSTTFASATRRSPTRVGARNLTVELARTTSGWLTA